MSRARMVVAIRRPIQVAGAFLRLGISLALKYPLGFVTEQLGVVVPVLIYFFVARLVGDVRSVAGDYFTFVIVGIVGMNSLNAGLRALSNQLDLAITRGWFEMILVEPVPWRALPFAMAQWPVVNSLIASVVVVGVSLPLGAQYRMAGLPVAILVLLLGIVAGLAIGVLAGSVKVLAKRGDPVLRVYSMLALVLSGVYFPVAELPLWLRGVSFAMPHTYVISGLRSALMPAATDLGGISAGAAVAALAALDVVLLPLAVFTFGRAMEYGRRLGVLSGY